MRRPTTPSTRKTYDLLDANFYAESNDPRYLDDTIDPKDVRSNQRRSFDVFYSSTSD